MKTRISYLREAIRFAARVSNYSHTMAWRARRRVADVETLLGSLSSIRSEQLRTAVRVEVETINLMARDVENRAEALRSRLFDLAELMGISQ